MTGRNDPVKEVVGITADLGAYMSGGKISVIVPCFNIDKYIDRTVQSILNQNYKNLEIILVDDGSTDSTSRIIDKLGQTYENIYSFHKKNGGVTSARLFGINHASGDWIAFVDGDDLLKPEMYKVLIDNALLYNTDISHCGYEMVFPDRIDKYYGTQKVVLQSNFEGQRDLLSGKFVEPSLCNKIYKRWVVIESKEECSSARGIRNMEDLLWNYYFFKRASKSVFIDECYYQYVIRKGSAATTSLNRRKLLDPLRVFMQIEKDVSDSNELKRIIRTRKVASLIGIAALEKKSESDWEDVYIRKAKLILRKNLLQYLCGSYSVRIKGMILLASISPRQYALIHRIYANVRRTNRKYDI